MTNCDFSENYLQNNEFIKLILSSLSIVGGNLKETNSSGEFAFIGSNQISTVIIDGLQAEELHAEFMQIVLSTTSIDNSLFSKGTKSLVESISGTTTINNCIFNAFTLGSNRLLNSEENSIVHLSDSKFLDVSGDSSILWLQEAETTVTNVTMNGTSSTRGIEGVYT